MKQSGVTLVEMLIVVMIVGLLAVAATPFTSAWTSGARISEALSMMEQAVGRAKANAMRNPTGVKGDTAVTALCFANSTLSLVGSTAANTANCQNPPVVLWSATPHASVLIRAGGGALGWQCSCFNNKGMVTKAGACNACGDNLTFTVTTHASGADSETLSFF